MDAAVEQAEKPDATSEIAPTQSSEVPRSLPDISLAHIELSDISKFRKKSFVVPDKAPIESMAIEGHSADEYEDEVFDEYTSEESDVNAEGIRYRLKK